MPFALQIAHWPAYIYSAMRHGLSPQQPATTPLEYSYLFILAATCGRCSQNVSFYCLHEQTEKCQSKGDRLVDAVENI